MLQRKNTQAKKEDSNYTPSYSPTHGEFENLCFNSVASTVCMSHEFVYGAVKNVNKIVAISSTKPPSYPYV